MFAWCSNVQVYWLSLVALIGFALKYRQKILGMFAPKLTVLHGIKEDSYMGLFSEISLRLS